MSAPRRYELVYIVTPDAPEEQVAAIHEQVDQTVQKMGGTLEKSENWGRRKLAYEIQHHKDGVYVLEVIVGSGRDGSRCSTGVASMPISASHRNRSFPR